MSLSRALFLLACALLSAAADFSTYIGDVYPYHVTAIATDASGNTYVTGSRMIAAAGSAQASDVFVSKIDRAGTVALVGTFGGNGTDAANGIAVDASGNIYVAGNTTSTDFPLLNPVQSAGSGQGTGFLIKLKPDGTVIYSTYLGGASGPSLMTAVAADAQGNAYVTGQTFAADSGCMPGLPCSAVAGPGDNQVLAAYFAKISPNGDRILYSGRIAGKGQPCSGLTCVVNATSGTGIAVDASGNAYLAGNTYTSSGLPTTSGVLHPTGIGAFVGKVNAAGTGLAYLTFLGTAAVAPEGDVAALDPATLVYGITADAAGNAYIAGRTWDPNFPATPSAFQPTLPVKPNPPGNPQPYSGFVAKLNPTGSAMVWASFLGGSTGNDQANTIALDPAGGVWTSGTAGSADFPVSSGFPGGKEFVAEFNPSGSALVFGERMPNTAAAPSRLALDAGGTVHLATGAGVVSTLTPSQSAAARIFGIGNAAGGVMAGRVAPGEVISIYGLHLGPAAPIVASPDSSGFYPTALGGIQLTIAGTPAPLLYVSDTQINAVVPLELADGAAATLRLSSNGTALPDFRLFADAAIPQVFRLPGGRSAAAINQDGTINSMANPAKIGSIVAIWVTGIGRTPGTDGQVQTAAQSLCGPDSGGQPRCTIQDANGQSIAPAYAGAAPGLVTGIVQINFAVTGSNSFYLAVNGTKLSDEFSIFLTR